MGTLHGRHVLWARMSVPPGERLPAARIASHLGVMAIVAAVMGVVVAGLAIPFAGVLGIGAKSLSHSVEDLPANLRTQPLAQQTKIVDQAGNTIATLYDQNRINVPLSQISRKMVKSIVAIEDYRYYQHGALDLKGTLRALVTNQASGGSVQGGSSITQQMVKMTLVDQAKTAKAAQGGDGRHLRPQAHRAALRDRLRAELLQGLDPRALPQHRLLRRRGVRRTGGGPPLLRHQRQGPHPAPGRHPGRSGQEPVGLRPDHQPRPRPAAPQRRARPAGPAPRDQPAHGRQAQEAAARAAPGRHAQRLRELQRAVLLRLRRELPRAGPRAGQDGRRPARSCSTPAA